MPRDINGTYTLPPGNPVIPNTIIATNWANTTMDDIAAALTGSLSVDGSVTTAKLANSAVTTIKIANNAVTRAKLSTDLQGDISGRNYIINGAMQIWQAATSLASGTGYRYSADMVPTNSIGTTYTVIQQPFTVGQTDVDPQAQVAYRAGVTSVAGAGNLCYVQFPIEDVRTLAGKQVTFSFYAMSTSGNRTIAIEMGQIFGSGGSAIVTTYFGQVTITTTWARYSVTGTIPNINGKTIGSAPNGLYPTIWFDAGSNFNSRTGSLGQQSGVYFIWGVKLEEGSEASPFQVPTNEDALLSCSRYYWAPPLEGTSAGPLCWSGDTTTGLNYHTCCTFPTRMYYIPTCTWVEGTSTGFPATVSSTTTTSSAVRFSKLCNATGTARIYTGTLTADARL